LTQVDPVGHELSVVTTQLAEQYPPGVKSRVKHTAAPQSVAVVHGSPMVGPHAATTTSANEITSRLIT
jgi:hypothetical protein